MAPRGLDLVRSVQVACGARRKRDPPRAESLPVHFAVVSMTESEAPHCKSLGVFEIGIWRAPSLGPNPHKMCELANGACVDR